MTQIELENQAPGLVEKFEEILSVLKDFSKEKKYLFVEASSFADDVKYLDWNIFNKWHFNDNYLLAKNANKESAKKLYKHKQGLNFGISESKGAVGNTKASKVDDWFGKSFELRYLLHLVGDLHQPLHNASMVDKDHLKGDQNGTRFLIAHKEAKDLHTLWDKCLLLYDEVRSPISDIQWEQIQKTAKDLMSRYTREELKERLSKDGLTKWSNESKALAKEAYKGLVQGKELPKDYIEDFKEDMEEQLVIAAYRLTDILKKFGEKEETLKRHRSNVDVSDDDEGGNEDSSSDEEEPVEKPVPKKKAGKPAEKKEKDEKTAGKGKENKKVAKKFEDEVEEEEDLPKGQKKKPPKSAIVFEEVDAEEKLPAKTAKPKQKLHRLRRNSDYIPDESEEEDLRLNI